jgi:hypothetical protein
MTRQGTRAPWRRPAMGPAAGPVGGAVGARARSRGETTGAGVVDVPVLAAWLWEQCLVEQAGGRCDTTRHGRVAVRKASP